MSAKGHQALAFEPFSQLQAEIDYNVKVLRRTRIVSWDCSTRTLQVIRDELARVRDVARESTWYRPATLPQSLENGSA